MKKVYQAADIPNLHDRDIFFDANVLLYVFFTSPSMKQWPKKYSLVFRKLIANGNRLFIDYTVLSEVINRELRLTHKNYEAANGACDYKTWRNSVEGQNAENRTHTIIRSLLSSTFQIDGKVYNSNDIKNMLVHSNLDFTDKAILNLCQSKNYILLTNDCDFLDSDIEILSANPRLT